MITPPTDNLYKFMAIFGIFVIMSGSGFWWNASNNLDSFFTSNKDYLNYLNNSNEAYVNFAKKVNEGIAIYNSVGGKKELFTKEQNIEFDNIMIEAEKLKEISDSSSKQEPADRMIANTHMTNYENAKLFSILSIVLGLVLTISGFYLWYTRLQKYIDELQKTKNV